MSEPYAPPEHAEPGHVPFGPEPTQVIPAHWVPVFLTILFREHRPVFSQVMVKVIGGEMPAAGRRRPGNGG